MNQPVGEGEAGEQAKGSLTPEVLAAEAAPIVALLDSGAMSTGALGVMAADTSLNAANINLIGLAQTGIVRVAHATKAPGGRDFVGSARSRSHSSRLIT